jgi:hypothetical protein
MIEFHLEFHLIARSASTTVAPGASTEQRSELAAEFHSIRVEFSVDRGAAIEIAGRHENQLLNPRNSLHLKYQCYQMKFSFFQEPGTAGDPREAGEPAPQPGIQYTGSPYSLTLLN